MEKRSKSPIQNETPMKPVARPDSDMIDLGQEILDKFDVDAQTKSEDVTLTINKTTSFNTFISP